MLMRKNKDEKIGPDSRYIRLSRGKSTRSGAFYVLLLRGTWKSTSASDGNFSTGISTYINSQVIKCLDCFANQFHYPAVPAEGLHRGQRLFPRYVISKASNLGRSKNGAWMRGLRGGGQERPSPERLREPIAIRINFVRIASLARTEIVFCTVQRLLIGLIVN